jgi:hypothetical protein
MSFAAVLKRLTKLENPYPGLRPFETSEAHLFFGRDQQVLDLLDRMARNRFVAVLGLSGSGKSSLVYAGLIPALLRGRLLEPGLRWRVATAKPRGTPFANLAESLGCKAEDLRTSSHGLIDYARRELSPGEGLFVLIDQFEELFRYKDRAATSPNDPVDPANAASEASAFIELLLASTRCSLPVYVVMTMRTDYLGDCAEFPEFPEALNESQYLVPRLTREERRQAIEGPLVRARISSALVERILNDAGDEPDQLPILQHVLMRTWSRWRDSRTWAERPIGTEDYETAGGFEGALNQHADELLDSPAARSEPKFAEIIFKRLTALGRGNRERRDPATLSELWELCSAVTVERRPSVNAIIEVFRHGEATFLSPREGELAHDTHIDITHECLIRNWKVLAERWLPEEETQAHTFIELLERARGWQAGKKELLTGVELSAAVDWDERRNRSAKWAEHYAKPGASEAVESFLKAARLRKKRRRWAAIGLPSLLLVSLVAYWDSHARQKAEAEKQQDKRERVLLEINSRVIVTKREADAAEKRFQDAENALPRSGSISVSDIKKVTQLGDQAFALAAEAAKARDTLEEAGKVVGGANFQRSEAFKQIEELQTQLGETQKKLDEALRAQHTAEEELQKRPTTDASAHYPIDWKAGIQYARLVKLAENVPSAVDDRQLKLDLVSLNYTFQQTIYGNGLATDIDPEFGKAVVAYGFLALSPNGELVVSIRDDAGAIDRWTQDARFLVVPISLCASCGFAVDGFAAVYHSLRTGRDSGSSSIFAAVKAQLDSGAAKRLTICGHGLGGALATLVALDVAFNTSYKGPLLAYSYGSPRVGDHIFAQKYNQAVPRTFRIVNQADIIAKLPLSLSFEHVAESFVLNPVTLIPPRSKIKPTPECMHQLTTYIWQMEQLAGSGTDSLPRECGGS